MTLSSRFGIVVIFSIAMIVVRRGQSLALPNPHHPHLLLLMNTWSRAAHRAQVQHRIHSQRTCLWPSMLRQQRRLLLLLQWVNPPATGISR